MLGGDHYITFPILKAYAEKFGPLAVIHFDAHSDLWPDDDLSRIDHGTMMYKAVKPGYVDPEAVGPDRDPDDDRRLSGRQRDRRARGARDGRGGGAWRR